MYISGKNEMSEDAGEQAVFTIVLKSEWTSINDVNTSLEFSNLFSPRAIEKLFLYTKSLNPHLLLLLTRFVNVARD